MKPDAVGGGAYDPSSAADVQQMMSVLGPIIGVMLLIGFALLVFVIFCYWKILSKAGYSGALSLLMLVPIANFILLVWFAFADWPVLKGGASSAPMKT